MVVVYYDNGSSVEGARQSTYRLINQERVDLLFGPYSSVLTRASAEVAENHQRLLWNQGGAASDVYRQRYNWVVGILTPADAYLDGLLPLVRGADGQATRVGIIRAHPGAFPREVSAAVERRAGPLGFQVTFLREYPPSLTDFTEIVEEMKNGRPEVLVAVGRIHNDIQLARQLIKSATGLKALAVVAAPIQQFRDALGNEVEGILGPSQWEPETSFPNEYGPPAEEVLRSLAHGGGAVDYPMAQAYAAGLVAQACVERAGVLEDGALREAANQLDFATFFGRFKIEPETGRQVGRSTVIIQWQQGRKVVLWPAELSRGSLLHPWRDD